MIILRYSFQITIQCSNLNCEAYYFGLWSYSYPELIQVHFVVVSWLRGGARQESKIILFLVLNRTLAGAHDLKGTHSIRHSYIAASFDFIHANVLHILLKSNIINTIPSSQQKIPTLGHWWSHLRRINQDVYMTEHRICQDISLNLI